MKKTNTAEIVNINGYTFLVGTSAMLLNIQTGMVGRTGNPFTVMRSYFPSLPKDKNKAMLYIGELIDNNPKVELRITDSVRKYIDKLRAEQKA